MPLISFVVVAFEQPNSLRTCLSSILDQTLDPKEIEIVVCDNSIDMGVALRNKELCLIGHRIKYIWTESETKIDPSACDTIRHRRCLYTATEIGVKHATGDWLCFPNQDSYYARPFAERMLRKTAEESCEFVYCDIVLGRADHRPYAPMSCAPANCCIDKTNFVMRREWFAGFKQKWAGYEIADGYMVDDLMARGIKPGKVSECLVVHN